MDCINWSFRQSCRQFKIVVASPPPKPLSGLCQNAFSPGVLRPSSPPNRGQDYICLSTFLGLSPKTPMPRLVVNPDSPEAWFIELQPGTISLGRSQQNDVPIEHPSVSSAHCQITVSKGSAWLKDLGSTAGTFVNDELHLNCILTHCRMSWQPTPGLRCRSNQTRLARRGCTERWVLSISVILTVDSV
jgi:hypothetical protein